MDLNNYTLLCDFYELTMANGYFQTDYKDTITYFDLFYRKNPDHAGFVICAGLESVVNYINNLHFSKEDIGLINEYFKNLDRTYISQDRLFEVFKHVLNNKHSDKIFNEIVENRLYKIIFRKPFA